MSSYRLGGNLSPLLLAVLLLPGCQSLNPLCGSSRPVPVISAISPNPMVFAQLPASFVLTVTGSHFVSASVVVFQGTTFVTAVNSSTELTVTITAAMISGPGSYHVMVHTPSGTSGDLGCSSGGNSSVLTLTIG
jgi:hypothetical protein